MAAYFPSLARSFARMGVRLLGGDLAGNASAEASSAVDASPARCLPSSRTPNRRCDRPRDRERVLKSAAGTIMLRKTHDGQRPSKSGIGFGGKPRETRQRYKRGINPTAVTDPCLPHLTCPRVDAWTKESNMSAKVGEELTPPTSLHGPRCCMLSLAVKGSVVHKRPAAGEEVLVEMREHVDQELRPHCH